MKARNIDEGLLREFAWSWHTSENGRGQTVLTVQWRTGTTADDVARFVELYEAAHDCELEFMEVSGHGASDWRVRYDD